MDVEGGFLLFSATATKIRSYEDLFPVLKNVVEERAPIYQHAPSCVLGNPAYDGTRGTPWKTTTSWTYFSENIVSYLAGEELFPIYDDAEDADAVCIEDVLV